MNSTELQSTPARAEQDRAWAQDALAVQNACNLGGVAHSFTELQSAMAAAGLDTEARANHPATRLYACKIADLAGLNYWYDGAAERAAKELIAPVSQPVAA